MIILDTNILSELMRKQPHHKVISWLDTQEPTSLYVTSITFAEIYYGIMVLSDTPKKILLEEKFKLSIDQAFGKMRVFDFCSNCAHYYGQIMSLRKSLGRPMSVPDAQIASIAKYKKARLATRNIKDFEGLELNLIDPFTL